MSIPRRTACTLFIVLLHVNNAVVLGFVFPKSVAVVSASSSLASSLNDDEYHMNDYDEIQSLHRRSALEKCGGIALSSLLLSSSTASVVCPANAYMDYDDTKKPKKRILITGSNSGIGLDAAQRMVVRGHEVVLACVSKKFCSNVIISVCCSEIFMGDDDFDIFLLTHTLHTHTHRQHQTHIMNSANN